MASKAGDARGETCKIDTIASNSKAFAFIREMAGRFARVQQDDAGLFEQRSQL